MTVENTRIVQANGVDICVQTLGNEHHPAILLVHGAAASMLGWPDSFCQKLVAGGRYVIRYDHRDTGQSITYEPGAPPYGPVDLVNDAVGLLDTLDIPEAHIVGISMGGGIAQHIASNHPERVCSMTLMATSPGGDDLPPPSDEFLAFVSQGHQPDWTDRQAIEDHIVEMMRVFSGVPEHFDEPAVRAMVRRDIGRSTVNVASSLINHFAMKTDGAEDRPLSEIEAPTLVIHGTRDPLFPIAHAQALAERIPNAELLALDDVGHLVPWHRQDIVVPAILEHTQEGATRGD